MCIEMPLELEQLRAICHQLFTTGEYIPRSAEESNWIQRLGFEEQRDRLVLPPGVEWLDRELIQKQLSLLESEPLARRVQIKNYTESTNQDLISRVDQETFIGSILTTELQLAGRGRFGRTWYSPVGRNLAVSLGVEVTREQASPGTTSLVAGIAVAASIRQLGIEAVQLKWPNDILLDGKKAGGILVDLVRPQPPYQFVIGVGLNTGGAELIQECVDYPIADITHYYTLPLRNKLIPILAHNLYEAMHCFEIDGFRAFMDSWNTFDALRDKVVTVATQHKQIHGIGRGVLATGELCVELSDGRVHHVVAGQVTLRSK